MKSLVLSLVAFMSFTVLSAQTVIKPSVGLNFTDFSGKIDGGEFKSKVGYQIGGSVAFGKKWYIEPGLFYVGKTTEFSTSSSIPTIDDIKISGIRVPVAVGLNLIGNGKSTIGVRGFGGLSGFFVTNVSDELNADDINKTNFGVFAGAGLDFWKLFLDVSYEWSLTNVQKDVSQIDIGNSRSIFITTGLRINL